MAVKPELHGVEKLPREDRARGIAALRRGHVDEPDGRESPCPGAALHLGELVLAERDVVPSLKRRCRRAKHHTRALYLSTQNRRVARVVAGIVVLLVARIVLLVHDYEPKVADRREDGASGPHYDASRARAYPVPLVVALAVGKRRVQDRHLVAEARREPADGLGREGNLGNHHDRAAVRLKLLRNRLEIHLGLARPGDAEEKARLRRGGYDAERRRLLAVQR